MLVRYDDGADHCHPERNVGHLKTEWIETGLKANVKAPRRVQNEAAMASHSDMTTAS